MSFENMNSDPKVKDKCSYHTKLRYCRYRTLLWIGLIAIPAMFLLGMDHYQMDLPSTVKDIIFVLPFASAILLMVNLARIRTLKILISERAYKDNIGKHSTYGH